MPDPKTLLTRRTWEEVQAATAKMANQFSSPRPFNPSSGPWSVGIMPCVTTSTITPFNGNTYGTGTVNIMLPTAMLATNGNTNSTTYVQKPNNAYNTGTLVLNGLNTNGMSINSNTQGYVGWCNGFLMLVQADCNTNS